MELLFRSSLDVFTDEADFFLFGRSVYSSLTDWEFFAVHMKWKPRNYCSLKATNNSIHGMILMKQNWISGLLLLVRVVNSFQLNLEVALEVSMV